MADWKVIVPEATLNIFNNPSFELGTTGWAGVSNNTVASSDEQSFKGDKSLEITYDDSLILIQSDGLTLTAVAHTYTFWVYLPAAWDGGAISLAISGFTSATVQVPSNSTLVKDAWVELTMTFTPDAGDLGGRLHIQTAAVPTVGLIIYADAAQLEAKDHQTTYCDGDQEGCSWDGPPHASTSRRQANSRAGGRVMDLEDDFGFRVQRWPGTGFAPVDNISNERVTLPGAEWQRARLTSRAFVLGGTLIGDDPDDLWEKRKALVPVFSPFAYDGGPVTLRYTGAAVDKEIRARYAGGLELDKVIWKYEQLAIALFASDPRFLALGENSEALAVSTLTTRLILGKIGGQWSDLGPPDAAGTYTSIRDIKAGPDGKIYVCGVFQNFDNVAAADYIARYDPINDTWEAVGSPNSGGATITSILKMAFAPNGDLYVVGVFENLAGVAAADFIARYSAAGVWGAVGIPNDTGANITDVRAVAVGFRNRLYVGGDFINLAGLSALDYIAYYQIDTGVWTAVGGAGASAYVNDIWAAANVDIVYATGNFTTIDGVAAARVAQRFLGEWRAMGAGLNNPGNRILQVATNVVYVTGQFTTAGLAVSPGAAFWLGDKWSPMAAGLDDPAQALAQLPTGELLIGGSFENIVTVLGSEAIPAKGMAYWNGSVWSPPEFLLPGTVTVYAAESRPNGDFYLGYDTTGNTEVPATTTISNNGTAPAWPLFVITLVGGASSPLLAIENASTGKRLTFSYEMEPGETLWIDLRPKSLGMYHHAPDGSGAGRFFRFAPDANLADFYLRPGDNDLNLYIEFKSGATATAAVRWLDSYESVDG